MQHDNEAPPFDSQRKKSRELVVCELLYGYGALVRMVEDREARCLIGFDYAKADENSRNTPRIRIISGG